MTRAAAGTGSRSVAVTWWRGLGGDSISVLFLACIVVLAAVAPWITPYDPLAQDLGNSLAMPSLAHPFGTDDLGRDIMSRLMLGTRVSVEVGFGSALISLLVGTSLGLWAGYRPGIISAAIMRGSDVLLAFPAVLLAMVVAVVLHAGSGGVMLAIAVISVPTFVRLAYAVMLAQRHQQYVEAAEAFGASSRYVIFRAVLPNALGPLAVQTAFTVANAVLLEAGLSFLGLGVQPPTPDLGTMVATGADFLPDRWWESLLPGAAILFVALGFNLLGDGLRDLYDVENVR